MSGLHCGPSLIYGTTSAGLDAAPAIQPSAYRAVGNGIALGEVTRQFGAPLSKAELTAFLGLSSLSALIQNQPAGTTCAYYLNASNRSRAYQLCFNGGYALVGKALLTAAAG
jgi:hypothetical protein